MFYPALLLKLNSGADLAGHTSVHCLTGGIESTKLWVKQSAANTADAFGGRADRDDTSAGNVLKPVKEILGLRTGRVGKN